MTTRHVLVVASSFPPSAAVGAFRTVRLVEHATRAGWTFTVLTGSPSSYQPGTPVDVDLLRRIPQGTSILRAATLRPIDWLASATRRFRPSKSASTSAVSAPAQPSAQASRASSPSLSERIERICSIPDQEIGWLMPAISRGLGACWSQPPDVIYSSAPPWTGHLVAGIVASLTGRQWVADFRDPWARAPWRSARMLPFEKRAAEALEKLVVTAADALIFTTRAARDEFVAHHGSVLAGKCHVVRNGCDPATFDGVEGCPPADRFVLMHAGSLYGRRNPIPLLRAIASAARSRCLDTSRFRLRFVGTVADVDLGRAVKELGLEAIVECVPRVSHRESLVEIRSASALLLLQPGTTMSVPAKTFEYLAAGRPVFALAEEGETAEIVRASGIGVAVPPTDEQAIEEGLLAIMQIASGPTEHPPRDLFDGGHRSAEMMAILAQASARREDRPQVVTSRRGWARWGS